MSSSSPEAAGRPSPETAPLAAADADAAVRARVDQLVQKLFEVEPAALRPEARLFQDLGLDSLDAIDLIIAFQKEFKIRPPNEELQAIRTLADVHALVARHHAQASLGR